MLNRIPCEPSAADREKSAIKLFRIIHYLIKIGARVIEHIARIRILVRIVALGLMPSGQ